MKFLVIIVFLNLGLQNDLLKSTSEILISGINSSTNINETDIRALFDKKVKIYNIQQKKFEFEISEFDFGIKRQGEFFKVRMWTFKEKPFRVSCFEDLRIFDEPKIFALRKY